MSDTNLGAISTKSKLPMDSNSQAMLGSTFITSAKQIKHMASDKKDFLSRARERIQCHHLQHLAKKQRKDAGLSSEEDNPILLESNESGSKI